MDDRERIERCLAQVHAYRASGKKAKQWAAEQGMPLGTLTSWCTHAAGWQRLLDGQPREPRKARPAGFVGARLEEETEGAVAGAAVRVDVRSGTATVSLHWPLAQASQLAAWVRELGR